MSLNTLVVMSALICVGLLGLDAQRMFGEDRTQIGLETSVPHHMADGEEFQLTLPALLAHGELLFKANWTEQEGGGRPLTKGTGRPISDPSQPLTGGRGFNRISGPDANSC